jgi:hypothetical protein
MSVASFVVTTQATLPQVTISWVYEFALPFEVYFTPKIHSNLREGE